MKTKVIDTRKLKQDPEKVVAYWVSQGGKYVGFGKSQTNPFVGIDGRSMINSWSLLDDHLELIDLPEEEFKTGDRVVEEDGSVGTYIGFVDGIHYFILDLSTFPTMTSDIRRLKHYKEPEPFEGWVNLYPGGELGGPHKTKKKAEEYGALDVRIIKVREVKDED